MTIERAKEFLNIHEVLDYKKGEHVKAYLVASGSTVNTDDSILAYSNVETAQALLPSSFIQYPCYGICLWLPVDAPKEEVIEAAKIVCALSEYPVLDDSDYSEREQEAINEACSERWLWKDVINDLGLEIEVTGDESADELRDKVLANGDEDGRIYESIRVWALGL